MVKEKVLVTGGEGDIAQAIKKRLKKEYYIHTPNKNMLDVTNIGNVISYMSIIKPDILINNAGYITIEKLSNLTIYEVKKHFNINTFGTFLCTKHALKHGCKLVINIGSSAGTHGKPLWTAYCASKAAVHSMTQSLGEEGYPVTCLSIGRTDTKMRHKLFPDEDKNTLLSTGEVTDTIEKLIKNYKLYIGKIIHLKKDRGRIIWTIEY
jgi:3-oxoacyl-[acyl-carrier protein] reductase